MKFFLKVLANLREASLIIEDHSVYFYSKNMIP